MAALEASDVTYTPRTPGTVLDGLGVSRQFLVEFGDATDTYPTGGVPIDKQKLGCPNLLRSLKVLGRTALAVGASNNPVWEWNGSQTNPKLVGFSTASGIAVTLSEISGVALAAQDLVVDALGY